MDALAFLRALKRDQADILFLDPPFNLGKDYGEVSMPEQSEETAYLSYMSATVEAATAVVKPGGALFMYHLPRMAVQLAPVLSERLEFRHWIAVSMKNGFVRGDRLYPAHYALLYFSKGPPAHFTRPRISPTRCKTCGGFAKDYGGYRSIIEEKGVNLSDVWDDLSPVRHSASKNRSANELPLTLTDRVVAIAGVEGGLLIDPFAGSGTSLVSAFHGGMRFIGNDLDKGSIAVARDRVEQHRREAGGQHRGAATIG